MRTLTAFLILFTVPLVLAILISCGDSEESVQVELPVQVEQTALTATSDLGYQVEVTHFRMAVGALQFTTEGEVHASSDWLVPSAYAHPGHYAGGSIVGELNGTWVIDLVDVGGLMGDARFIVGDYTGANFELAVAGEAQGLAADDSLAGHTAEIRGRATRNGETWEFTALIDQDPGRQVVGAPFDAKIGEESQGTVGMRVLLTEPVEGKTLFDGIDFSELGEPGPDPHELQPESEPWNRIRRAMQSHDFYAFTYTDG